jgi:hypothetical protein
LQVMYLDPPFDHPLHTRYSLCSPNSTALNCSPMKSSTKQCWPDNSNQSLHYQHKLWEQYLPSGTLLCPWQVRCTH